MLEVGNGDLTIAEQRSHFTLWCLIKAPLLLGNDLRNMSTDVLNIITNTEVIALNQDPLGVQGYKRSSKTVKKASHTIRRGDDAQEYNNADDDGTVEVWAGELAGGDVAVVLFNRSTQPQKITAHFDEVGLVGPGSTTEDNNEERTTSFGAANVRDLWAHQDLGVYEKSFTATVDSHGVVALRLTPVTRDQISIA
jgi:alpha-galactosidase